MAQQLFNWIHVRKSFVRRHLLALPCYASIAAVLDSLQTRTFEESLGDPLSSFSTSLEPLNPQRPLEVYGRKRKDKMGRDKSQKNKPSVDLRLLLLSTLECICSLDRCRREADKSAKSLFSCACRNSSASCKSP
jgi:hypothetical protein